MAITLYYFPTPNGRKISIALEEMGLAYRMELVNIFDYQARSPEYLAICPNGRIPAIVDSDEHGEALPLFESGAILQYLGRKSGLYYPQSPERTRTQIDAWLFWQMSSLGPMTGQVTWFKRAARKPGRPAADTSLPIHRFTKEVKRLYEVLNHQLDDKHFICGEYSIADIACWPWVDQHHDYVGELAVYPNIANWHQRIAQRPAVQRACQLGVEETRRLLSKTD